MVFSMPIYEYQCDKCGKKFEAMRPSASADDAIPCGKCSSQKTKRIMSTFFARNSVGSISGMDKSCGSCTGGSCADCCH